LTSEPRLRATVIHQRLAERGFGGSYQRVKLYVAEARKRLCPRPPIGGVDRFGSPPCEIVPDESTDRSYAPSGL